MKKLENKIKKKPPQKKEKKPHKNLIMPLKMIEVDVKIAPVVRWLNSYSSSRTLFCCQNPVLPNCPYVMFSCDMFSDLRTIVNYFSRYPKTWVEILPSFGIRDLVYRLNFTNQKALENFVKRLPKKFHN